MSSAHASEVAVAPNQRYVVTGAAGAIGSSAVTLLLHAGCQVIAIDRLPIQETDSRVLCLQAELSEVSEVEEVVRRSRPELGISGMILAHGGASRKEVEESPLCQSHETFESAFRDNLLSTYLLISRFAPIMQNAGIATPSIVVASSINARTGLGYPGYSAAKAGVESLIRTLSPSLAQLHIRLNAVALGTVWDSDMSTLHDGDPNHLDRMTEMSPFGAVMTPVEAATVLIEVLTRLGPMNGETIRVDYGQAILGWRVGPGPAAVLVQGEDE